MASTVPGSLLSLATAYGLEDDPELWQITPIVGFSYMCSIAGLGQAGASDLLDEIWNSISERVSPYLCISALQHTKETGITEYVKAISKRVAILAIYSMFIPGYRILNDGGTFSLLYSNVSLTNPYGIDPIETAVLTWIQNFAPNSTSPYDVLKKLNFSIGNKQIFRPLGTSYKPLTSLNLIPLAHPSDAIVSQFPTSCIMNDIIVGLNSTNGANADALRKRWVAALFSDEPWLYYSTVLPGEVGFFATSAFVSKNADNLSILSQFETWYANRLTLIPTVRQALELSLGIVV